ncbi:MAG: hypothetical protein ACI9TI_000205 [Natronomonas sp.]|jgi:hypothetical protein
MSGTTDSGSGTLGRRVLTTVVGLAVVTSLLVSGIAGSVGAQGAAGGDPDLEVFVPDPTLTPGTSTQLELQIANDAKADFGTAQNRDRVTVARNVRIEVDADDAPISVESGRHSVGSVSENQPTTAPIAIDVPEDADPGEYEIDVELEYSYTSGYFPRGEVEYDRTRTVTRTVEIEIDDGPRFALTGTEDTTVQISETGTVAIDVENIGAEPARDVAVRLESPSSMLTFGERSGDTARIDRLAPGETKAVAYEVSVAPDAPERTYELDGTVRYTDPDGIRGYDDDGLSAGVETIAEQAFSMTADETTLHADEEGDVAVTITNDGPVTAHDVSVNLAGEYPNVRLLENSVSAGTLAPGESTTIDLPFDLGREADPVSKTLDVNVGYRTADGERRADPDHSLVIDIQERRDAFLVEITDATITADSSRLIEVEVTNNRDQRLTDVEAKLGTSDPLDSDDDAGYVEALAPGETTTMTFELSATSDANPKTYSVAMDLRYDDEKGKTKMSNVYRLPVEVESSGGLLPFWLVPGGLLSLVAVGGIVYSRRRQGSFPGN